MFLTLNAHDFTSPPTLFTPSDLPVFYVMNDSLNNIGEVFFWTFLREREIKTVKSRKQNLILGR